LPDIGDSQAVDLPAPGSPVADYHPFAAFVAINQYFRSFIHSYAFSLHGKAKFYSDALLGEPAFREAFTEQKSKPAMSLLQMNGYCEISLPCFPRACFPSAADDYNNLT